MDRKPKREVGRGERVLPGVWRLRLPLPYPGVPHCNAWALAAGSGVVLVDTGMQQPGSLADLERALDQVGLRLEHVRLIVCTHAHSDHCGLAAPIAERAGCEVWMHPNRRHMTASAQDPEQALARGLEIARQSGVPDEPLQRWVEQRRSIGPGVALPLEVQRDLFDDMRVDTDLGSWTVYETPGHAPSHVVLHQPERRLLLSGDHLLGRVSLYFDYGYTPDPVGEFLASLDRVDALDARLCLSGHGRTFTDVRAHVHANRALVAERLAAVEAALARGPATAYELLPHVYGERFVPAVTNWLLTKTLCYLRHLELAGRVRRLEGAEGEPDRWVGASS